MLINFALDVVGTAVSNDRVSADGFECSNLISTDFQTRKRGFIVEHFVKPPIHVTFTLPCSVFISHIVVEPYVGKQQSHQIDLMCASRPGPVKLKPPRGKHSQTSCESLSLPPQLQPTDETSDPFIPVFHKVSSYINSSMSPSPVCFYNGRFHRNHHRNQTGPPHYTNFQNRCEIRTSRTEIISSASFVMLKINRTAQGLTAALNNIEIWGIVSSGVSREERNCIEQKYITFTTPKSMSMNFFSQSQSQTKQPSSTSTVNSTDTDSYFNNCLVGLDGDKCVHKEAVTGTVEIPDEFLDAITCEVMTIPMLLPCGKNVDKSSLDRYSDSEANHGRQPRDPFTGVQFTSRVKPIPNASLKARIDAFLLSHSNDKLLGLLPRTVNKGESSQNGLLLSSVSGGSKRKFNINQVSKLVETPASKKQVFELEQAVPSVGDKNKIQKQVNTVNKVKEKTNCLTLTTPSIKLGGSLVKHEQPTTSSTATSTSSNRCDDKDKDATTETKTHEMKLKDSLDNALFSMLSSFNTNTNNNNNNNARSSNQNSSNNNYSNSDDMITVSDSESSSNCRVCLSCEQSIQLDIVAYRTPCSHLLCRNCLMSLLPNEQQIRCKNCGSRFEKRDVVRIH